MRAEGTFLYYPLGPDGNIRIKGLFHLLRPSGSVPVHIFDRIGTGSGTVPAPNTAAINLIYNPFTAYISGPYWTDFDTGRFIAMHTGPGYQPGTDMRIFSFPIF